MISILFAEQEAQCLLAFIDATVKAQGMVAAEAGVILSKKIQAAMSAAAAPTPAAPVTPPSPTVAVPVEPAPTASVPSALAAATTASVPVPHTSVPAADPPPDAPKSSREDHTRHGFPGENAPSAS